LAGALGFAGASHAPASLQVADGHQRMLQLLEQVRARADVENHYTGDGGRRQAESQLAALPADAPDLTRFRLNCLTSIHDMRLGKTEEAIQHLQEAYRLLPRIRPEVPKEIAEEAILQLAVAHLRLGETQNCLEHRSAESCILPIRGTGIHRQQAGARRAISYLTILLKENPEHLTARWLFNLAYMTVGDYPAEVPNKFLIPPEAFKSDEDFPRFPDVASEVGANVVGLAGGAIADDFDGDGFLDIVVSNWDSAGQIRYLRNKGDGTFSDQTAEAGLTGLYGGLNIIQADYDNDRDIDILVPRGAWLEGAGRHPKSLLRNDGRGRFRDVTFEAGLGEVHYPSQTGAWADYDNDGDLDLYAGNENSPSQLFRNNSDGTFTDVAPFAGVENNRFAKGVVWGDYDNDRFPDLYVSNLEGENRLYRNNRDGTFTDVAPQLGVTKPMRSFPVWFWDFNNDGVLDLYVASYHPDVRHVAADYLGLPHQGEPACLYQGDGKGGFREVAAAKNLTRVAQTMGCNFGDLDNDGFPDFYLGTGYPAYEALMPKLLFHNRGGSRFSNVTTAANVGHLQKGHGVSFADLDNDGDQDLFIKLGGSFAGDSYGSALFQNPGFGNHWLTLKLVGKQSNRWGVGARIRAEIDESGKRRSVYKWVTSGSSFGANPLRQEIGLGKATTIEVLEIFWPTTGASQRLLNVPVDQFIEIAEGESQYRKLPWKPAKFRGTK
jgi:FG-GAP-like repeat/ASPIC and UnbV